MNAKFSLSILLAGLLLLNIACKKWHSDGKVPSNPALSFPATKVLVLKVDFVTKVFKGGKEMQLGLHNYSGDSLPVKHIYQDPTDFGNLTLIYSPSADTLFDGSVVWLGCGSMRIPSGLSSPGDFETTAPIPQPFQYRFQRLHNTHGPAQDSIPWNSIANLSIVNAYLSANNKRIGYFLYTPSVGAGNPADWYWLFFFSN